MDLPENVLKRVKGLRKLHESYEALEKEYKEQRLALEKQFLSRKEALYSQRCQVVKGESDISEEGVLSGTAATEENPEEKGVPSFWLTALSSHPAIGQLITEEDVPALEALVNVTCEYNESFSEFTLAFHFTENDSLCLRSPRGLCIVAPVSGQTHRKVGTQSLRSTGHMCL